MNNNFNRIIYLNYNHKKINNIIAIINDESNGVSENKNEVINKNQEVFEVYEI